MKTPAEFVAALWGMDENARKVLRREITARDQEHATLREEAVRERDAAVELLRQIHGPKYDALLAERMAAPPDLAPPCLSTACEYHDRGPHCHPTPDPAEAMRVEMAELRATAAKAIAGASFVGAEAMRARCEGIARGESTQGLLAAIGDGYAQGWHACAEHIADAISALKQGDGR